MNKSTKNFFKINDDILTKSKEIYKIIINNLNDEEKLNEVIKVLEEKVSQNVISEKNVKLTVDPKDYIYQVIKNIKFNYEKLPNLKTQKTLLEQAEKIQKKVLFNGKTYEFDILKLPKNTNIFKSVSEFQNENKNKSYWDDNQPTFYGSYLSSIRFSTFFLNVYQLKTDIYLFDLNSKKNYENINILFPEIKSFYNKKVIDTSSLSNIIKYYQECETVPCKRFKGDFWIYSYLLANITKELYLIKNIPIYNYNIGSFYSDEDNLIFNKFKIILQKLNINGFFAGHCFNPLSIMTHEYSIYLEEIILYDKNNLIKRDIENPLDTYHLIKKEKLNIPPNFVFNNDYVQKNQNNQLLKFYSFNLNNYPVKIPQKNLIFTLNVHSFKSINENDESINHLIKLIEEIDCQLVCLPESLTDKTHYFKKLKKYKIFNAKTENFKNKDCLTLLYKKVNKVFEKKLPNQVKTLRKMICVKNNNLTYIFTHLEVEDRCRLEELKFILKYNPDFIVGDLNFKENSPEYHFLINQGFKTLTSNLKTTPFGTTVDYIWFKNNDNFIQTIIPYPYSDHRGVLLSLKS